VAGVLAPAGDAAASLPYGRLTVGQLVQATGSRLAVQVAGPAAGMEHDQVVTGGASIDGALLSLDASLAPRGGEEIVLIDNFGTVPISGLFRDPAGNLLPEGATATTSA